MQFVVVQRAFIERARGHQAKGNSLTNYYWRSLSWWGGAWYTPEIRWDAALWRNWSSLMPGLAVRKSYAQNPHRGQPPLVFRERTKSVAPT